jgi:hypothetical protein
MSSAASKQPFWIDGPEIQYRPPPTEGVLPKGILLFITIYRILITLLFVGGVFFILFKFVPILAWAEILFITFTISLGIYLGKQKKKSRLKIAELQQRAREQSGASVIGSAIHVAGHPLLEREQPVVLALTLDSLKIFKYDDQNPIDIIPLNELAACHTVVYDGDRIPRIDIVDSTAQALQVTHRYHDKEFIYLFRRMLKVRPIDWYHEIQKAQRQRMS